MKNKKWLIISIILIIISIGICLEINYLIRRNNKDKEFNLVYLEKETIETSIEKFNTLILDNGMNTSISKDNYIIKNNVYHYTIYENINLYIKPLEYMENPKEEITYDLGIYYPSNTKYEGNAKLYVKYLISINNPDLSNEEIEKLIDNAVKVSKENKDININTGISIRYFNQKENNNYKEFVIRRHYKDE